MPEVPPPRDQHRFASASGPVNRRTAKPAVEVKPVVHQVVRQRLARNAVQQALGSPLARQLAAPPASPSGGKTILCAASGAVLCVTAGVMAAWQASLPWAAASAVCGAAAGAVAFMQRGKTATAPPSAGIEPQALAALDKVLAEIAPKLPAATLESLVALKAALVRIALRMADGTLCERFTQDDRFYVLELVRRYLPDTLSAYLQVPAAQRGPSANELLDGQIGLLRNELSHREALLAEDSHAALQQQERFLKAKHRS